MGEKAKRVKLDYDAICDELDIQGKSKTWLSTEIGRSRSYFSNLPGTRLGATVPKNMEAIIQGVEMFEELYKFISRLHYGIKFMPEKDFDELLSRCDWEQKMYALCFRYW